RTGTQAQCVAAREPSRRSAPELISIDARLRGKLDLPYMHVIRGKVARASSACVVPRASCACPAMCWKHMARLTALKAVLLAHDAQCHAEASAYAQGCQAALGAAVLQGVGEGGYHAGAGV